MPKTQYTGNLDTFVLFVDLDDQLYSGLKAGDIWFSNYPG